MKRNMKYWAYVKNKLSSIKTGVEASFIDEQLVFIVPLDSLTMM